MTTVAWQGKRSTTTICVGALAFLGACGGPSPDGSTAASASTDANEATSSQDRSASSEVVAVTRADATESKRVNASVGFGPIRTLPIFPGATVTWAPEQNTVLAPGDIAVMLDEKPVFLAEGEIPMYRELRKIPFFQIDRAGNPVGLQTGQDVEQLQRFLIAQGFDDNGLLDEEDAFGESTDRALRAWQASVGHTPDGITNDTQLVFVSEAIRVESALEVGDVFTQLLFTNTNIILTINADTTVRPFFAVDQIVEVETGIDKVDGTVIKSTRTFDAQTNSAQQTILIEVAEVGSDQLGESVDVVGTLVKAEDVLTIPVRALLAFSDGGWGVEVPTGSDTSEWISVEVISVVDTTAVITGLDEGTEVVVPI